MAAGGTELAHAQLLKRINPDILENIHIVSRPKDLENSKIPVLWMQDLPGDAQFLASKSQRNKFGGIVFVSSWQQHIFNFNMGVEFAESKVIRNAIDPIPAHTKPDDGLIRLIYHPTPHRGLQILVPVFIKLCEQYDFLHLDVFSNFDIYGWGDLNKEFEPLYEQCEQHPNITYHGSQPHDVVLAALQNAHIFAYPCIWRETSCMSAMEAMSARCAIVAPDYGALPETLANYNMGYDWTENMEDHAKRFSDRLVETIFLLGKPEMEAHLTAQKNHADTFYSWETRIHEWEQYLSNIKKPQRRKATINWMER